MPQVVILNEVKDLFFICFSRWSGVEREIPRFARNDKLGVGMTNWGRE